MTVTVGGLTWEPCDSKLSWFFRRPVVPEELGSGELCGNTRRASVSENEGNAQLVDWDVYFFNVSGKRRSQ